MNLLSTSRAALMAQCTPDNIRYYTRKGRLSPIRVDQGNGRFECLYLEEDIQRFLREQAQSRAAKKDAHEGVGR